MKKLTAPYSVALGTVAIALLIRILVLKVSGWLLVVAIAEPIAIVVLGFLSHKYRERSRRVQGQLALEHSEVLALQTENLALSDRYRQLEEKDSIRGDFVENLVHSLGTKLAVIRTASELLGNEKLSDTGQSYLSALKVQSKTAGKLISDLLKGARLEASAIAPHVDQIDLVEWLPKIIAAHRPDANDNRQDLVCATEPKMPPLLTDASILGEIVGELLNNAIKYSRIGAEIRVSAKFVRNPDRHIIEVSNPGFILSRERSRIWERFYRIQQGVDATRPGDGLGLYLIKQQVKLLGGTIELSAKAKEQIVIFRIEI